ncbi:hypothetical protein V3C99_000527 [Haemonchus contortus]
MDDNEPTHNKQRDPASSRLLGDSDIAAIIAAMKADQPSSSTQTAVPSFARKGYASQYEFNVSLMQNLSRISKKDLRKEDEEILEATEFFHSSTTRSKQKQSNHRIHSCQNFWRKFKKKERSPKRRELPRQGQLASPFEGGNRLGDPIPEFLATPQDISRISNPWNAMDTGVISRLARLTRSTVRTNQTGQEAPVFCADTKDIGGTNVQTGNELMASGAIERVPRKLSSDLMIHPLSVAEDRSAREYQTTSKTNSKDSVYSKRKKSPTGSQETRLNDEDKKRSRTMSTSVAEAQSRTGAHSRQGLMLFSQQVLGQDIPCG